MLKNTRSYKLINVSNFLKKQFNFVTSKTYSLFNALQDLYLMLTDIIHLVVDLIPQLVHLGIVPNNPKHYITNSMDLTTTQMVYPLRPDPMQLLAMYQEV